MRSSWGSEHEVHLPLMDEAHQRLSVIVDSLERATAAGEDKEAVERLLLELVEHTADHFAAEQEVMRATGFPYTVAHVEEHGVLLEHVSALLASHSAGYAALTHELVLDLNPWLLNHIETSDRVLGRYLLRVGWPEGAVIADVPPATAVNAESDAALWEVPARNYATQHSKDPRTQLRLAQAFEAGLGAYAEEVLPSECPPFETQEEVTAWRAGWYLGAERTHLS